MTDELKSIQAAYFIELLFEDTDNEINTEKINKFIDKEIGQTELLYDTNAFTVFLLKDFVIARDNGEKTLAGLTLSKSYLHFDKNYISEIEYSQYQYSSISQSVDDVNELLNRCNKKILLGDWMCVALPYDERCRLLYKYLTIVLKEFPNCISVRFPLSGALLTLEECLNNPYDENLFFLNGGVSFRFFQITDGEDPEFIADTLGMYAIGLPDLQIHFHTLDPNEVVNRLVNYCAYIFSNGDIIKDDEKVSGINENDIWNCVHERSIIPPYREVLDFESEHFAGKR